MKREGYYRLALLASLAIPAALIGFKLLVLHYPLDSLVPVRSYRVDLGMGVDGHGEDVSISAYVPQTDSRQTIIGEQNTVGPFVFAMTAEGVNRTATWNAEALTGHHDMLYTYSVQARHVRYVIPESLTIPTSYPEHLQQYLGAAEGIQVNAPLIAKTLSELVPEDQPTILSALTRIHRYVQDKLENRNFSGYTDALTALKLGEASCNGKGRLFAALARRLNLPTRLVGGIIMTQGTKRTSHQWVEVYVNGHWVPFDAINDHFAEIPDNFLTLYYGDLVLFRHSANVNFQYFFKVTRRLVAQPESKTVAQASLLNFMNLYGLFERLGISQNLLKIILMLPFGALATTLLRNVVGLQTFGTFLPALIAAAARETGLFWGYVGFIVIILISLLVRRVLDELALLHTPKMEIMMTVVVIVMMVLAVAGVHLGFMDLAHVTLFPIALTAITAERFAVLQTEQGLGKALTVLGVTLLAVGACYQVMELLVLQSMVLVLPETLLLVIALNLWLGRWTGIRMMEFVRFRHLLKKGAA